MERLRLPSTFVSNSFEGFRREDNYFSKKLVTFPVLDHHCYHYMPTSYVFPNMKKGKKKLAKRISGKKILVNNVFASK